MIQEQSILIIRFLPAKVIGTQIKDFFLSRKETKLTLSLYNLSRGLLVLTTDVRPLDACSSSTRCGPGDVGKDGVTRSEVQRFIWEKFFKTEANALSPFTPYLSRVLSYYLRTETPIGCDAKSWWDLGFSGGNLETAKQRTVSALVKLQSISKAERASSEDQCFAEWAMPKMPYSDPNGRLLRKAHQQEILTSFPISD